MTAVYRCVGSWHWVSGILVAVGVIVWGQGRHQCSSADAADPADALAQLQQTVDAAEEMLADGFPGDAGLMLANARRALNDVADLGRDVEPDTIRSLVAECEQVVEKLATEGVVIKGIPTAQQLLRRRAEAMRREAVRGGPSMGPPIRRQPVGPSFVGQIAPMLVNFCGRCHVEQSRGDFSMRSYSVLAASGMVVPGDGPNSRLVEVIRTGDMPRGGAALPAEAVRSLISWINAGARFDGVDPTVSLGGLRSVTRGTAGLAGNQSEELASVNAIPGGIRFSSAVAGILVENCLRCHGGRNPSAGFSMQTFADLTGSGAIVAGSGNESLLIRKLVGVNIDGQRMPRGRPPLPDKTVSVIRQWIDEGARLDMLSPVSELSQLASEGRMQHLSHEALREIRFQAAPQLWQRGIIDEEGTRVIRADVCVVSNLAQGRLSATADSAEEMERLLRTELNLSAPLVKGGIVVFVFARGYDLSNFWQNLLERERPPGLLGRGDVFGNVVYAAVAVDSDAENTRLMLAAELAAATLRARNAPGWFAEAAGRCVARRMMPEAPAVSTWNDAEVAARSGAPPDPERFFTAPLSAEQVATASAMLATFDRRGQRLSGLIGRLDKGEDFNAAFRQTYQGSPEQLLIAWMSRGR